MYVVRDLCFKFYGIYDQIYDWKGIFDLNTGMVSMTLIIYIQLKTRTVNGIYDQLNTTFYGIYDHIYDWNGIYDLNNNIQL